MEATMQQILDARENRVSKQKKLLAQFEKPLLCLTMNIPGPTKWSRDIAIGFYLGCWFIDDTLKGRKILHKEICTCVTGGEAYYVVDIPEKQLKQMVMELEEIDPVGRLFDMDVLTPAGEKISRLDLGQSPRKCLLCDNDAALCARTRAHGLEALQARAGFYLYVAAREYFAEFVSSRAFYALYQEVNTTPKPGLVDKRNTGAHKDMTLRHFFVSANALREYFTRFTEAGFLTRDEDPKVTFAKIRPIGMEAEQAMKKATGGINTHKGAIFSMGLLCAAAGRLSPDQWSAERLLSECALMAKGVVGEDFAGLNAENAKTPGELCYLLHGITGVRGQAEEGFPAVKDVGLPILKEGLKKGLSLNDAGCAALLHILAATDDTNLIRRSDRHTQLAVKAQVCALLEQARFPATEEIEKLDNAFIEKNLSPGGSADLLAMCYLLLFLGQ